MKSSISGKEFAELLGAELSDINNVTMVLSSGGADYLKVQVHQRHPETGELEYVGPKFARSPLLVWHVVYLDKPGRPHGTTIANGAKPKTPKAKPSATPTLMHGGSSE